VIDGRAAVVSSVPGQVGMPGRAQALCDIAIGGAGAPDRHPASLSDPSDADGIIAMLIG